MISKLYLALFDEYKELFAWAGKSPIVVKEIQITPNKNSLWSHHGFVLWLIV